MTVYGLRIHIFVEVVVILTGDLKKKTPNDVGEKILPVNI